jgi:hypothetical protein
MLKYFDGRCEFGLILFIERNTVYRINISSGYLATNILINISSGYQCYLATNILNENVKLRLLDMRFYYFVNSGVLNRR